jgi:DNA-binding winged helix-turn-helix (wHTH) protein
MVDCAGINLGNLGPEKMQGEQDLYFGPHRLDLEVGQLWRDQDEVKLTPKALAVLRVLVARAGQVVTKDELFQTVWPQTVVSDDALTTCILELRHALRDKAKQPRYIETVHRRGYRFIALVTTQPVSSSKFQVPSQEGRASSQEEESQQAKDSGSLESKSNHITFVHFTMYHHRSVMLSAAKHLVLRPFASLRATHKCANLVWFDLASRV